jgi:hypothetical protein
VTDQCNRAVRAAALAIVGLSEHAPTPRSYAEYLEVRSADPDAGSDAGFAAHGDLELCRRPRQHSVEDVHLSSNRLPHRVGVHPDTGDRIVGDHDELAWIPNRQLTKHQTVDERKDRAVGADAERQRRDRDGRDNRRPHE